MNARMVLVAVLLLVGVAVLMLVIPGPMRSRLSVLYEDVVLDNRSVRVPCHQRPSVAEARRVLDKHDDEIQRIEALEPGQVFAELDEDACPGKATLIFTYGSHAQRRDIERLVGGETFFGIPYALRNV